MLMRLVRMATWTSGEPVSLSLVAYSVMILVFSSLTSMHYLAGGCCGVVPGGAAAARWSPGVPHPGRPPGTEPARCREPARPGHTGQSVAQATLVSWEGASPRAAADGAHSVGATVPAWWARKCRKRSSSSGSNGLDM